MPGGGRGGNGQRAPWSGAAPQRTLQERFDALEQLVLGLREGGGTGDGEGQRRGGGMGGRGQGGDGGGGGGKGTARAAVGSSRGRPGDWACSACSAFPCFARASICFRCGAPRVGGQGSGSPQPKGKGKSGTLSTRDAAAPAYLGPVGANGSKPLLGRRGAGPQAGGIGGGQSPVVEASPTFRRPGSSLAAKAEQERNEGGLGKEQRPLSPTAGSDATATTGATAAAAAPASLPPRPPIPTANRWAALDGPGDDVDEDGGGAAGMDLDGDEEEVSGGTTEAAGQGEQFGGEEEPGPADLRREWDKLCALCRRLERDGEDVPQSVLASVREQRDAAERRWRAAKPPQPLHKRLRWAEAELREAETKELARQRELEEHLAITARRTAELEQRLSVDRARTERRRSVLRSLQGREAHSRCPATEAATRIALQGISDDIAPVLASAVASLGEEAADTRQGLRQAVQALSQVQEVLREAAAAATENRRPAGLLGAAVGTCGDGGPAGERAGGDGDEDHDGDPSLPGAKGTSQRWTRVGPGGQWKKARTLDSSSSSSAAADEARRLLQQHGVGCGLGSADRGTGDEAAYTNDLGEAARRAEQAAQRQLQESLDRQQAPRDPRQLQEEEAQRQQRAQQQQLELQRHLAAVEQAAAARAAEEARQREDMVARMSPADLARAAEVHAQQLAVGAHAFGSQPASQVAGLVHQSIVQEAAQEAAQGGCGAEEEYLMSLSPEEFARWDRNRQGGDNGECPW